MTARPTDGLYLHRFRPMFAIDSALRRPHSLSKPRSPRRAGLGSCAAPLSRNSSQTGALAAGRLCLCSGVRIASSDRDAGARLRAIVLHRLTLVSVDGAPSTAQTRVEEWENGASPFCGHKLVGRWLTENARSTARDFSISAESRHARGHKGLCRKGARVVARRRGQNPLRPGQDLFDVCHYRFPRKKYLSGSSAILPHSLIWIALGS